MVKAEKLLVI